MRFKEIETKYEANNISMSDFSSLAAGFNPRWVTVSSYDDYYVHEDGRAIRYRYNQNRGELTLKQKTRNENNINRIEINMKAEPDNDPTTVAFLQHLGFSLNFCIYKTCKIAVLRDVVLVYYVVYDNNLIELNRYLEIEANEDKEWASEDDAWQAVLRYEKLLEPLGITPRHRLKKSLFEIYRR